MKLMKLMGTGSPEVQSTNERRPSIPLKRWVTGQGSGCRTYPLPFSIITTMLLDHTQIDLMNLGQWVAELDKRMEGILL